MMTDNSFQAFGKSLRGELIQPDDQRYDTARKLYNGMIDRWPRAIARCADVLDVITAVLGHPRRGRKLWRGYLLLVPATSGENRCGWANALAIEPGGGLDALVSRVHHERAGGY
jgi:hypothetical protein